MHAAWRSLNWPGLEHVFHSEGAVWHADSVAVLVLREGPVRVSYQATGDLGGATRQLQVSVLGEVVDRLALTSDGNGRWYDDGGRPLPELDGCLDVDISSTPFTNTLPVRRLGLEPGEGEDLVAAYVRVPQLQLSAMPQRYTCLRHASDHSVYRYESPGFQTDLTIDTHGLVVDYPGLWARV